MAFVHMGSEGEGAAFLARYGMPGALHVSDPARGLYAAFGLARGTPRQVWLSPRVLWGGFRAAVLQGYSVSWPVGDALQMPGVFVVRNGRIDRAFRHTTTADRPDYADLAGCTGDACEPEDLPPGQDSARERGQPSDRPGRPNP